MKLVSLDLKNFRQHLDTRIDFTDGVTGLVGANGGGKTTILEAIAWALYGAPAVRGTNDTIRSKASEGGAKVNVTLDFELSGSMYRVTRTLDGSAKSGTAVLHVDGKPLRSGVKEVSEAVTRLLGMDYQAFFTSFFTGQKQLEFMSNLEGRARANMISRMLGYERLTKARDKANDDRKGLQREVEGLEQGLADPADLKKRKDEARTGAAELADVVEKAEAARAAAQAEVDRLKPLKEASDQKAKRFSEIERRLELDRAEVRRAQERIGQLKPQLFDLESKRKALEAMQPDLERYQKAGEEYKALRALQEHEGKRNQLTGQITAAEAELKKLEMRLKQISDADNQRTRAAITLNEAEDQLRKLDLSIQSAREKRVSDERGCLARIEQIEGQLRQIEEKKKRIAEAGAEGVCPTCERPLAGELPKVLAHFEDEAAGLKSAIDEQRLALNKIAEVSVEVDTLTENREKLSVHVDQMRSDKSSADALVAELEAGQVDMSERRKQIEAFRAELSQLPQGFDPERFKLLQKTGEELRPKWDKSIELKADLKREPDLRTELEALTKSLADKESEIAANEASLKELDFHPDQHEELIRGYESAVGAANSAGVELERRRGELNTAQALLQSIEQEEQRQKERLDALKSKREERLHLQTLAEAFDKLRIELNDQIRPELEAVASELLATLTDGRYSVLEIDENYEARVRDDGELKPVISGGEEDVVNLALRLAISQMIADRAGQSFSLLVLDEVFGSLDEVRRENVVSLLQNLKNRFEQIILITHIESIHDAVDNCLWVQFDERTKTSRLTQRPVDIEPSMVGIEEA